VFLLGSTPEGVPRFSASTSHVLVLGPPRSGKTTGFVIPNVCLFPGPVIATSTKLDLAEAVSAHLGDERRVRAFDPSGELELDPRIEKVRWSPVAQASSLRAATLMAESFVATALGDPAGSERHWVDRAKALLAPLLLAAHLGGGEMEQVAAWVDRRELAEPLGTLTLAGEERAIEVLSSVLASEPRERSAILSSTSAALAAYRYPVEPADAELVPEQFLESRDILLIVSPALVQRVVAPVVVALIESVAQAAYARAQAGRPAQVALMLDEMANIAPLPSLGSLLSEGASQGVHLLGALQDLTQARARWPRLAPGLFTLFGTTVVLGGIGDLETLRLVEELAGRREELEQSWQVGGLRTRSRSLHRVHRPRFDRERVRGLGSGEALVLELRGETGIVRLAGVG